MTFHRPPTGLPPASRRSSTTFHQVLFALTKEDEADGNNKGLVALLPDAAEEPKAAEEALGVLEAISGVPSLPAAMRANALFQAQRIEREGFGIRWAAVEGAPSSTFHGLT